MSAFRLSSYADEDIESIFRYTIRKWSFDQADFAIRHPHR